MLARLLYQCRYAYLVQKSDAARVPLGDQHFTRRDPWPFEHGPAFQPHVLRRRHMRHFRRRPQRRARESPVRMRRGEQSAALLPERRMRPPALLVVVLGRLAIVRQVGIALRVAVKSNRVVSGGGTPE